MSDRDISGYFPFPQETILSSGIRTTINIILSLDTFSLIAFEEFPLNAILLQLLKKKIIIQSKSIRSVDLVKGTLQKCPWPYTEKKYHEGIMLLQDEMEFQ